MSRRRSPAKAVDESILHQQNQSRKNSPDVPSVPHKMEPQKPQVTPLRLPAEGEPYKWEWEWEAAKIVGMAEGTSGMFELPMKVVEVT